MHISCDFTASLLGLGKPSVKTRLLLINQSICVLFCGTVNYDKIMALLLKDKDLEALCTALCVSP